VRSIHKMKKQYLSIVAFLLLGAMQSVFAQKTFPQNGVYDERDGLFAFTNATIYKSWNEKLDNATLLIRDGRIEAVGAGIAVPKDAVVIDCRNKTIYPSFIEPFGNYGMPELQRPEAGGGRREATQLLSNRKGAYSWNESLKTDFKAHENFSFNEKEAEILRGLGIGAVVSHRFDGISRGSATVVSTGASKEHELIIKPMAAHVMSFSKGTSPQAYPQSLMGAISLLRQTYLDGQWYNTEGSKVEKNFSLEAWNNAQSLPQIFEVGDKLEALRAVKIANEFGAKYIIKGRGDEYQRISEIKATGASLILSLAFPEAMDVEDPYDALNVSLEQLKHWEMAATNPRRLAKEGIEIAFTTHLLKDKKDFLKQIQKAIENGLSEADALKALTATPAKMLNINDLGDLSKGKIANFLITNGNIFSKETKMYQNWVQGKGYVLIDMEKPDLQGTRSFKFGSNVYKMMDVNAKGDMMLYKNDTAKVKADVTHTRQNITISFTPTGEKEVVRLFGTYDGGVIKGNGQLGDGTWVAWEAVPMAFETKADAKADNKATPSVSQRSTGEVSFPFGAFGRKELPKSEKILFKNATVWTSESEGVLANTDVVIENGKILQIGKNLTATNAKTVDATGKHLTAGVIDEHSHIALSRGTNEGTQSCTAEVRIADVINSEDVNIYRQLAGGVTSSHILHGSANAIGGQTQLIKMRWGMEPEKMKFEGWQGYIKFALGENVKQSNWNISDDQRIRFPQTRMGVEQVYNDHFTRAKEYLELKKAGKTYRKDLELEALVEILEGKRHITCHSYVQSEITMLIRLAERFGFKINTFTHILEGYKVADKMAKHGAAGAGFADWWAYKMEVIDAIPQSPSMMMSQGVLTTINSDDAEMARRLNQEAAKSTMYADMKEEDAWKMVTINPAKTLRVGDKTGSIKVGKDADVVLWNDNPLSIYAKAEQTYVDGVKYFDREEDKNLQVDVRKERARIIQKMIQAKKGGAPTQPAAAKMQKMYDCEDVDDEMRD
jgi:imidazolonepropionase-like amidohydrolase